MTASLLSHVCPVESLHFALSLSALIATSVYLGLRKRFRLHAIGAFVAPVALTFLVGAQFVGSPAQPGQGMPRALLALHITANLLGVGLFLLAGAAGAFYLVQESRLKHKRFGKLTNKLPPLDALDSAVHRLLLAGFPLLTFGIVTGAVFASSLDQASTASVARAILSLRDLDPRRCGAPAACHRGLAWTACCVSHDCGSGLRRARDPDLRAQAGFGGELVIVVVGLSHRTAPIAVRELLAISRRRSRGAARRTVGKSGGGRGDAALHL